MGQVDFPSPYWDNVSDSAKVGFQCPLLPYSLCVLMELLILARFVQGDLMILLIQFLSILAIIIRFFQEFTVIKPSVHGHLDSPSASVPLASLLPVVTPVTLL